MQHGLRLRESHASAAIDQSFGGKARRRAAGGGSGGSWHHAPPSEARWTSWLMEASVRSRFVVGWCMAIGMPPSSSSVSGRHAASSASAASKVAAGAASGAAASSSSSPSAAAGGAAPGSGAGKVAMLPLHKAHRAAEAAQSLPARDRVFARARATQAGRCAADNVY